VKINSRSSFQLLLIVIFFVVISFFNTGASFASDIFHEANKAYVAGDFEKALKLYEEAKQELGWSSGVLFNLGNTYHQLGRYGQAVLSYKRALYLNPSNQDAIANLNLTLKEAGVFLDERFKITKLLMMLSPNRWAYVAIACFAILAASIFGWGVLSLLKLRFGFVSEETKRPMKLLIWGVALVFALACIGMLSQNGQFNEAIVTANEADVLVSPFDGASHILTLKTAKIVTIERDFQNYYLIKNDSGQSGWVKKDKIERVIP